MDPLIHTISAWDGLPLRVLEWPGDAALAPLLCLPGLVRVAEDFEGLAAALPGRRVVALDYAGRGGSGRADDGDEPPERESDPAMSSAGWVLALAQARGIAVRREA